MPAAPATAPPPPAEPALPGITVPLGSCDATASGAEEAQVRLMRKRPGGLAELTLCAHHTERYWLVLIANGWVITRDQRGSLA